MLETSTISVNFGQGLDTKTDPKLVVNGKLSLLENGVFTNPGRVTKRPGNDAFTLTKLGGGSLSSPKGIKSYQNELVAADSGRLYSYSTQLDRWIDKGKYQSIKVTDYFVSRSAFSDEMPSAAINGNIALYAWSANGVAYAKVVDLSTNTVLLQDTSLGGATSVTMAVKLGASTLGVFFTDTAQHLFLTILTATAGGVSFSAPVTVSSNMVNEGRAPWYDVATTSTGAVIAAQGGPTYSGTPAGVDLITIDTAGNIINSVGVDTGSQTGFCRCFVGSNGNIWLYWARTAASPFNIYYAVYSSTLSTVLAQTLIASPVDLIVQFSALPTSATTQTFFYSTNVFLTLSPHTFTRTVNAAGSVGAATQVLTGVFIASDPIAVGSSNYMAFGYPSSSGTQSTLFLLDLSDYGVVAKAFAGKWSNGSIYGTRNVKPVAFSGTKIGIPTLYTVQLDSYFAGVVSQQGFAVALFDFSHPDSNQALIAQNVQIWNGGVVTMYDGNQAVELGFHLFPESPSPSDSGSGSGPNGTFQYFSVYRWFDAQGNMHQSAPSPSSGSFTIGSGHAISVVVQCLHLTQKNNPNSPVQILLYRTTDGGTVPYLVSSIASPTTNNPISDTVTFTDTTLDSNLIKSEIMYSNSLLPGGVIENTAPPPAMLMASHNNRIYLVSSEDSQVWYSKTLQDGVGLSFSDLFAQAVDARGGEVTAIASMDDKFVAFKNSLFFVQSGDGPNDTGSGSTLTNFQLVPSDVGCTESKGVFLLPPGLIVKSAKGFYLSDRALNVSYIGSAVEAYNAQNITAVTLISDKSQVRFLTDSGVTLVYDYTVNNWSTFTNFQGYAADLWNGVYVYARTDGNIYKENPSTFLDNGVAYKLRAQTAWLKLNSVQGFQRVRRVALLGDYLQGSGHGVQISAAYDFVSTFSTPISYLPAGASGVLQYRERLPQQKCESIQLLIEEVTTGASGEYIDFTDLAFEAGIKRGINKLPASQSVG